MKAVVFACFVMVAVAAAADNWKTAPTPVFLLNASDKAKEQFYNIITRDWTTEQKSQAIEALVATLDETVQKAYAEFKQQIAEIKNKYGQSVENQVS
uniref:Apolipophorin-III n=1 Tax=Syphacia muris TaxID=451379 RepID=A0A0N5APU2_9BILA